jgi:biotin transport system permease protein
VEVTPRLLRDLDPRLKMALTVWLGVRIWQVGPVPAMCLSALAGGVLLLLRPGGRSPVSLKGAALTVILWVTVKAGLDLLVPGTGNVWEQSLLLGLRLSFILCLGTLFFLTTTMRNVSLAVVRMSRPVLGDRAWQVGLALGLMVHFIPTALSVAGQVRHSLSLRLGRASLPVRASLLIRACLRTLGEKTWSQTLALAARGFDSPRAWEEEIPVNVREWVCVGLGILAAEALFFLSP